MAFNRAKSPDKERIVESMTALYFGRVASFVLESKDLKTYDAELLVETQALKFEELKPFCLNGIISSAVYEKWK